MLKRYTKHQLKLHAYCRQYYEKKNKNQEPSEAKVSSGLMEDVSNVAKAKTYAEAVIGNISPTSTKETT